MEAGSEPDFQTIFAEIDVKIAAQLERLRPPPKADIEPPAADYIVNREERVERHSEYTMAHTGWLLLHSRVPRLSNLFRVVNVFGLCNKRDNKKVIAGLLAGGA